MKKQTVFLTGATGAMGMESLRKMSNDLDIENLVLLVRDSRKNRILLEPYGGQQGVDIHWGDLTSYSDVVACVRGADIVVHLAALVSPAADYEPERAMRVNYGSTWNIIRAVRELGQAERTRLVYIGTVAETGDRMPPIHWGRVGDPVKSSVFDYYAVSKTAAERLVIESGLRRWVSLRQTGMIGPAMCRIEDAIMFHNPLNNGLEYVSDRDSGRMTANLCRMEVEGRLPGKFWGHIYNVGGGESCRTDTYDLFREMYRRLGITELQYVMEPRQYATHNFHGQYYLDSDRLEQYLHFRNDTMEYFYDCYIERIKHAAKAAGIIGGLRGGQKLAGNIIRKRFRRIASQEHGTLRFIREDQSPYIDVFWGSKKEWEKLPRDIRQWKLFTEWDKVIRIEHGYDEEKPEEELDLEMMKEAAAFRGGRLCSDSMEVGDWSGKLTFCCAFGHTFTASPRLVLEGGHWCPVCERTSWNYGERAKRDPFFAQVWNPLHRETENQEYKKVVSELDV